jgi:hypothetical protein
MLPTTTLNGSNRGIFIPRDTGSPHDSLMNHISRLGPIARLDFERGAVAGEVIYTVEGDSTPVSQQDEEARIATLAYALKKLGNREDAAEFMRCLNAICEEGDARYRQVAATYYSNEIAERGAGIVLKEMALIAMQLAALNPVTEEAENGSEAVHAMCGKSKPRTLFVDYGFAADDLPACARHLASELRRAYTDGVEIDQIWDDVNAQLDVLLPVRGRTAEGGKFFSRTNIELQQFSREVLETLLEDFQSEVHLTAMRHSDAYRRFYRAIREADDTRLVGQAMKDAYAAKESGELSLKYFTLLKTVSTLQRERLMNARLSPEAYKLIREVETASPAKLRHLSWAFYGDNLPEHYIHQLRSQEKSRLWDALKARKHFFAERGVAMVMAHFLIEAPGLSAEAKALFEILRMAISYYRASRLPKRPAFHRKHNRQVEVTVRCVHRKDRLHHRA